MKDKKNIIIIILMTILIVMLGYVMYDKVLKNEKCITVKESDVNNKDISNDEKVNLIKELGYGRFHLSPNTYKDNKTCDENVDGHTCNATFYFNDGDKKENEKFDVEYKTFFNLDEQNKLLINNKELNIGYFDVEDIMIVKIFNKKDDDNDISYQYLVKLGNSVGIKTYIYDIDGNLVKRLVDYTTYYDSYEEIALLKNNEYYTYLLFYKCSKGLLSQYAYNFNNLKEIKLNTLSEVMCSAVDE